MCVWGGGGGRGLRERERECVSREINTVWIVR